MISIVNILRNAYQGIEARTSSHFTRDVQVSRPRRCPARRKSDCDNYGTSDRSVGLPEDAFVPLIEVEFPSTNTNDTGSNVSKREHRPISREMCRFQGLGVVLLVARAIAIIPVPRIVLLGYLKARSFH